MTAKQKAQEIYDYLHDWRTPEKEAKRLAQYTVQQIILSNPHSNPLNSPVTSTMAYWQEVLTELKMM